ncbi:MAG TPA: hypothetical protein VGD40_01355 [Chryseosolibacter sp.]
MLKLSLVDRLNKVGFGAQAVQEELKKAAVLRIILGIFMFVRFAEVSHTVFVLYGPNETFWTSVFVLMAITLFTVGLFTPIVTLVLIFCMRWFELQLHITNLGSIVVIFALVVLVIINQGTYYSLDALLMRKRNWVGRTMQQLYGIIGTPSREDLTKAFFLGFLFYALISLGAALFHFEDDYWKSGVTLKSLLTNSFLCKHYTWFRHLEDSNQALFSFMSASGGLLQGIFQLAMIPLIFFRWGRIFIVVWGFIFFIISFFLINLSYLPSIEILFWILIFWRCKSRGSMTDPLPDTYARRPMSVLYSLYGILFVLFIVVDFPIVNRVFKNVLGETIPAATRFVLYKHYLIIPDVFNRTDLSMGDHWAVVTRYYNSEWQIVPLVDEHGSRLNYQNFDILNFTNHNSDVLYFATTLSHRRSAIYATDFVAFYENPNSTGFQYINTVAKYDREYLGLDSTVWYHVAAYRSNSSSVRLWEKDLDRHKPGIVYSRAFRFEGDELKPMSVLPK